MIVFGMTSRHSMGVFSENFGHFRSVFDETSGHSMGLCLVWIFLTFGHCMRVWDDFWTLYGSVFKETFWQPIRVHSVWILDFWTLNRGMFSVTSGLTSASLQLLMNLSIWDSREFSKTSLCSSCPFRQVRIRQRKGWWLKSDLLQEKRWKHLCLKRCLN